MQKKLAYSQQQNIGVLSEIETSKYLKKCLDYTIPRKRRSFKISEVINTKKFLTFQNLKVSNYTITQNQSKT